MAPKRLRGLPRRTLPDGTQAFVADRPLARLRGLAWLDEPAEGCALLFPRCRSVHTFGMRFALEVTFLDGDGNVLKRLDHVPPRRMVWCRNAAAVLERPAKPERRRAGRA